MQAADVRSEAEEQAVGVAEIRETTVVSIWQLKGGLENLIILLMQSLKTVRAAEQACRILERQAVDNAKELSVRSNA